MDVITDTRADAEARAKGYTDRYQIEGGMEGGEFLVRPGTDLDTPFRAWAVDWQEWTVVHGYNCTMEALS